jgi:hypothetical protein
MPGLTCTSMMCAAATDGGGDTAAGQ